MPMLISACEYHPDLGLVGLGNGVPQTELEARDFAERANRRGEEYGQSSVRDR